MKAIVYEKYGPPEVLKLKEINKPVPGDHEILVKIHATTVTAADSRLRKPDPFIARLINGLFKPSRIKILGMELSGIVEEVGDQVSLFKKGDEIFGFSGFGAYKEYKCFHEKGVIIPRPSNLSLEESAAIPLGATTALYYLQDKGKIAKGQKVLIYGASGSVGTYAIQLAHYFGAEVTGVCSGSNLDLVKSIGANHVIDYTKEDFQNRDEKYDTIFDAVGKISSSIGRKALVPGGTFVTVNKGLARGKVKILKYLKELAESGDIKPVIDKTYSMDEMVEAHRYVDTGRKKGNVVILVTVDLMDPIIIETTFNTTPEKIWEAITQVEQMRVWFFDNIPSFEARVGFQTQFDAQSEDRNFHHIWKITEVVPGKKITYEWSYAEYPGTSYVTFELLENKENTVLWLTNEGLETFPRDIPEFSRENCKAGWDYFIGKNLKNFLEE